MGGADPGSTPPVSETDFVPISALQHYLYCPRQCALIHVERVWMENRLTAEGRILHGRVEQGVADRRFGIRTERSVPVRSRRLGLAGVVDVVEVHQGGRVFPVEYKRAVPSTIGPMKFNSARRRSAWRRCWNKRFRKERCSTVGAVAGRPSCSMRSSGRSPPGLPARSADWSKVGRHRPLCTSAGSATPARSRRRASPRNCNVPLVWGGGWPT